MRDEFASTGFLAVTVAGLVLLCSGFVAFAFTWLVYCALAFDRSLWRRVLPDGRL